MLSEMIDQAVFKSTFACIASCCSWLVGGFDVVLLALFILYSTDFSLGFYQAWKTDSINSDKLRQGFKKTILYIILVVCARQLDLIVQVALPSLPFLSKGVRNFVVGYAALCEFLSVCVHLDAQGARLPISLIRRLNRYRDKMETSTESNP